MLKTYIKTAWRNLLKSKGSSFINIYGLAVGMSVSMLIGLWVYDELTFDTYHRNYKNIAHVMQQQTGNGNIYTMQSIPMPLGEELQTNYGSNFKYLVMASWVGDHILSHDDKMITEKGIYMDKDGPNLLTLQMLKGTRNGLNKPNSILLSASTAKAMFNNDDPIGKILKIDSRLVVQVTGVYADLPYSTTFRDMHFIAPWELYVASEPWVKQTRDERVWDNNSFQMLAQINDNTSFSAVNKKILYAKLKHVAPENKKYNPRIFLHPMRDWHLRSHWENGVQTGGLIEYVRLFSIVGIFVLLLACINFMNLSTARSEKRAKEVGIRKTISSLRSQLIGQFYSESLLIVVFAFLLALLIVSLSLPWFNTVAAKKMTMPWTNILFWLTGIGVILITGIVAGSYPALYLSSFQPVKVLKGTFRAGRLAAIPRKILVVFQFTISLALIIGTIIVYNQVQFARNRPLGYDRNSLMMIQMKSPEFKGKYELLRTELKASGAVTDMSASTSPVTGVWSNNSYFSWPGKDPHTDPDFATIWVTYDFGKTVGWQFAAGRDLSRDFKTDSSAIVINEAAVKFMGLQNPIGTPVKWGNNGTFTIVGVIKDMVMESPYQRVKQTFYFLDKESEDANWVELKLNPQKSASQCIATIQAVFKKYVPSDPLDYKFVDDEFATKFAAEVRIGKLSAFFAILAIFISCLGLFGLSSYITEQRTKEIGIRKILGASVPNLWGLLSKDFVIMVIAGCLIAIPIASWFMNNWLMNYVYRTTISWWIFAMAGAGALLVTLLTVSFQAIKAAVASPVTSLRSE